MHFAREQARADYFYLLQNQISQSEPPPRKLWECFLIEFHPDLPANLHMNSHATGEPSLTQTQAWINLNLFYITTQYKGEKP